MKTLAGYAIVFLGAGIGGMFRHAVNRTDLSMRSPFPWGTLAINVSGGLIIGLLAGWFAFRGEGSQHLRLFLVTGVVGGFTTFSAFSLEAALLSERGQIGQAIGYVGGSVLLSIAAVFLGLRLMRT